MWLQLSGRLAGPDDLSTIVRTYGAAIVVNDHFYSIIMSELTVLDAMRFTVVLYALC
jgi:hypothetical protein